MTVMLPLQLGPKQAAEWVWANKVTSPLSFTKTVASYIIVIFSIRNPSHFITCKFRFSIILQKHQTGMNFEIQGKKKMQYEG